MRNLLALMGAGTLTFVGLGWYLDWYRIERKASPVAGTQRLEVDLNPQKIGTDVVKGGKKVGELIEHFSEKEAAATPTTPTPDATDKDGAKTSGGSSDTGTVSATVPNGRN